MKIYADVLVCINFIINLMALKLTKKFFNSSTSNKRLYISSFIGGISSFIIFIPIQNILFDLFLKLIISVFMVIIAFDIKRISSILKYTIILNVIAIIFAGVTASLNLIFPNLFFSFVNGVIYFNVSPILLFSCILIAYIIIIVFDKIVDNGNIKNSSYIAIVYRDNKFVTLNCYFDTGNKMTESFSGLPVMLVEYSNISALLYNDEKKCINNIGEPTFTLRPVFYRTINGEGMLYAFKPDKIVLKINNINSEVEGYVAVSVQNVDCNGCNAIIGHKFVGAVNT